MKMIKKIMIKTAIVSSLVAMPQISHAESLLGPYIGVNVGAVSGTTVITEYYGVYDYGEHSKTDISPSFGAHLGYDHPIGSSGFVGFEIDAIVPGLKNERVYYDQDYIDSGEWNALITSRAKLGLAMDNVTVYVTGGIAYADTEYMVADDFSDPEVTHSEWQWGYVGGVGASVNVGKNISIDAKYLHVELSSDTAVSEDYEIDFSSSADILSLGVSYHFNID